MGDDLLGLRSVARVKVLPLPERVVLSLRGGDAPDAGHGTLGLEEHVHGAIDGDVEGVLSSGVS